MFSVSDQDVALAFYTAKLGWEVRGDMSFGPDNEHRWIEGAPPGSVTRLALNPPMAGRPGGSAIGIEVDDVLAEHARLTAAAASTWIRNHADAGRAANARAARPGREPPLDRRAALSPTRAPGSAPGRNM
jgi:catechol 2,3-dioxygenase-like lactoylglutathione lyase family enzyme